MSGIVALGDLARVQAYRLAGVDVLAAGNDAEVEAAWAHLPRDTGVLILTATAAAVLEPRIRTRRRLLWTVLPE